MLCSSKGLAGLNSVLVKLRKHVGLEMIILQASVLISYINIETFDLLNMFFQKEKEIVHMIIYIASILEYACGL